MPRSSSFRPHLQIGIKLLKGHIYGLYLRILNFHARWRPRRLPETGVLGSSYTASGRALAPRHHSVPLQRLVRQSKCYRRSSRIVGFETRSKARGMRRVLKWCLSGGT
jgi:hypothetical protein